jgi:hypothetical protein
VGVESENSAGREIFTVAKNPSFGKIPRVQLSVTEKAQSAKTTTDIRNLVIGTLSHKSR